MDVIFRISRFAMADPGMETFTVIKKEIVKKIFSFNFKSVAVLPMMDLVCFSNLTILTFF
jgi:hypothetical protein